MRAAPDAPQRSGGISEKRVDIAIVRIAAGFGVIYFIQMLPLLLNQAADRNPVWLALSAVVLGAGLAALLAGTFVGWASARIAAAIAIVYVVALAMWPLAVGVVDGPPRGGFWLHQLLMVAVVVAVIAFPLPFAIIYVVLVPTAIAILRIVPAWGAVRADIAILDALYAIVVGALLAISATMIRSAARAVDRARETALERYAQAARDDATDSERVAVDALVHDNVLTTLIAASRATTPEGHALAAQMAAAAIRRLSEASDLDHAEGDRVAPAVLATRLRAMAAALTVPIPVRIAKMPEWSLPREAADALVSAAQQAMINSAQHAGHDAARWVSMREHEGRLEIEVVDEGRGFSPEDVPAERMGVRVSIIERVANVGGRAEISSAIGGGTRVRIVWPEDAAAIPASARGRAMRLAGGAP